MAMKLKEIFHKKIDRNIEGVIKAGHDSEEKIRRDLEEFVVTNEVREQLDKFFKAYDKALSGDTENNGVWISGFFGSGKSHFLKILSYILKKQEVDGKNIFSYFKNKGLKKSTLDNINKLDQASRDVVLFNIASKANQGNTKEAIVNIFNRAFNEVIGLCSSKPWVAAMESELMKEGIYEAFKDKFKEVSGKSWIEGRERFYYHKDSIISALVKTAGISEDSAKAWCDNSEREFTLTVESFALRIKSYCESKGENHQVVFLIDEIGQYLGRDSNEILNLQTLVEELGMKCKGKCWVVVTSQDELRIFTKENSFDFSKIQGRFHTQIALTSSNGEEVIKKRLLKKNKKGEEILKDYFQNNEAEIKNLVVFSNESGLKGYENCDDFIESFPFVTYQFQIIKRILESLREEGVSGNSLSSGERSLLDIYQRVALEHMNEGVGNIVPLGDFYKPLEEYINLSARETIFQGEKNQNIDNFTLKVLKTLFLIKHVDFIEASQDNIVDFMISNLKDEKSSIKERTRESLAKLVSEGLVEKCGASYIFLTEDEGRVNREINTYSPSKDHIEKKIGEIIFGDIYKETSFRYSPKHKFSFNRFIDSTIIGVRRSDIGIRVITCSYPIAGDKVSELKRLSTIYKDVIVDITEAFSPIEAVEQLMKIDLYLRKNHEGYAFERLKERKKLARELLVFQVEELFKKALRESTIYISGTQLQQNEKNGVDKIQEALSKLIANEYFKLDYVNGSINTLKELRSFSREKLKEKVDTISEGELALEEVKAFIERTQLRGGEVNLSDILSRFTRIPYGWKEIHIQAIIIQLLKEKKIKGIIKDKSLEKEINVLCELIIDKKNIDKIFFKARIRISAKYLDLLQDLGKSLFNQNIDIKDSEEAMEVFKELSRRELKYINHMLYEGNENNLYPGRDTLNLGKRIFNEVINLGEEEEFYKEIYYMEEDLEEYIQEGEPLKKFYFKNNNGVIDLLEKGHQRLIFHEAIEVVKIFEEDRDFIDDNEIIVLMDKIKAIVYHRKPYELIKDLPELMKKYHEDIKVPINREVERLKDYCGKCKKNMEIFITEYSCDETLKNNILQEYVSFNDKIMKASTLMKLAALEKLIERKSSSFEREIKRNKL